ncbi:MAG TPA: potassium channel family protein [Acidobacteriota bacterium]|nr:potassium channel family protein [Acidobacteriota bacterium]HQM63516.1 potassium channel family protein [Acidobacteriota bacterium]
METGGSRVGKTVPKPVREITHRLTRLWWQDYFLSLLLVGLVVTIFLVYPLGQIAPVRNVVANGIFSLIVISGVLAVARGPLLTLSMLAVTVANLAVRWLNAHSPEYGLAVWDEGLSLLALLVLTVVVLIQVYRPGRITPARIMGAVAAYLLLGIMWGYIYHLVLRLDPGAFQMALVPQSEAEWKASLLYFSFVTLTTVGYGDILPVNALARSLANLESLIGMLFPAILIARLVSLEIIHRPKTSHQDET